MIINKTANKGQDFDKKESAKFTPDFTMEKSLFREIIKKMPAPIAIFDKDMRYLMVSDRWLEDYKVKDRNVIGRSHYEIFPNLSKEWKEIHQRCLKGETLKSDEDSFVQADGRTEYVKWEVIPWRNENNEIGGIIIFSESITKLKELEIELRKYIKELERENRIMINRELKMVELKEEIERLKNRLL